VFKCQNFNERSVHCKFLLTTGRGEFAERQTETMISGLEFYIKKKKCKKPESKAQTAPPTATTTLPQILKGFNHSEKPGWMGGVKKSEVGGVFDTGGCRRLGLGVDLAKAERMLEIETNQRRTEKLIQHLLIQPPNKDKGFGGQGKRTANLPPIGGALSLFCENRDNMVRVRNGPGFLKVEPFEDDVRLIRVRGPRYQPRATAAYSGVL
jgi:hypothetical protein